MNSQKLTRKELYDLVWSTPFAKLAKIYAISDAGLRKNCVKMGIPIPDFGHWAKVQHNKDLRIKELPENHDGVNEVTFFLREEVDTVNKRMPSANTKLTKGIADKEEDNFIVPERLTNPCNLIIRARESYNKFRHWRFTNILMPDYRELNISATQDNLGRALRFMDTFIKIMENRGHKIYIKNNDTILEIKGEEFKISLREKARRVLKEDAKPWSQFDFIPTGILVFSCVAHYTHQLTWSDEKLPIEQQLAKMIAKLELKGEELEKESIEWEKARNIQKEKLRIEEERQKRQEKELNDVRALLKNYRRWKEAENIRKYLGQEESLARYNNCLTPEKQTWIQWAKEKTNWLDPLIASEDEFLDEDDKDELFDEL